MSSRPAKKRIPVGEPSLGIEEERYVLDAVRSGWVSSLGPYIERFEKEFAAYIGTKYALSTMNGTTALHLILAALDIGPGDEVIVPDLTFVATANAVAYTGATPVMVDVDPRTWCMDPAAVARAITRRTKAIIPVHVYGYPADMPALLRLAKKHRLLIVEDAAEAHGAMIGRRKAGSFGVAAMFSFYGNKIITTGEGGMVVTNSRALWEKMRHLRDHSMDPKRKYWHTSIGFNYRITNLQAALGVAQLARLEPYIAKKLQVMKWYRDGLRGVPGIQMNPETEGIRNVYWMVCLVLENKKVRDGLCAALKKEGIDTRPFFYPMSDMPMYRRQRRYSNPVSHSLSARGVNLPSAVPLTKADVARVCSAIKEYLGHDASGRRPRRAA